jgi:hypothetical protein
VCRLGYVWNRWAALLRRKPSETIDEHLIRAGHRRIAFLDG